jgi:hypothetical protein
MIESRDLMSKHDGSLHFVVRSYGFCGLDNLFWIRVLVMSLELRGK